MKNELICNNCGTSNPIYSLNCTKCNSFLRARVPNIDLWDTIWSLFISPIDSAVKIIQAEKKNFLVLLLSLWFIKSSVNYYILSNYHSSGVASLGESLIKGGVFSVALIMLFPFLVNILFTKLKIPNRLKDVFSIITFSLVPIILVFVILTPFHFALYGFYWYTVNPSPLIIKPLVTYVLYGIEGVFYLWVLVLFITSLFAQTNRKILSALVGILLLIVLLGYQFLIL
ncbi:MAG: hypothetical protein WCZ90_11705 [Melioribacteraceae bacterium]